MTIFYGWELGANLGHTSEFAPVKKALEDRGIKVTLSLRASTKESFQAPFCIDSSEKADPVNYPDICLNNGWRDHKTLLELVNKWRAQLIESKAKVVIADFAPTLMLAARTLGIPVMLFGAGFYMPPKIYPIPAMRGWNQTERTALEAIDNAATASANAVLRAFGKKKIMSFCDLFNVAEPRLKTIPEFDPYRSADREYWGVFQAANTGANPIFADVPHKIFAYLRQDHPHFSTLINALGAVANRSDVSVCAFVPGVSDYTAPARMKIVSDPVNLQKVVEAGTSVAVGYSPGFSSSLLCAGIPTLLAPTHIEQFLHALEVRRAGAGLIASPEQPLSVADVVKALEMLIASPVHKTAAESIKNRYAALDPISAFVDRAIELAGA